MSDLISRKAILQHFSDWQMELSKVGSEREYNLLDMIIRGVENEPTAFDLESAIQQIEEKVKYAEQKAVEYDETGNIEMMDIWDIKAKSYRNALEILKSAADTIETLSAKLQLADTEQSDTDQDDRWIYCGDGKNLPEEHETMFAKYKGTDKWNVGMFEKMSDDVNVTVEYKNGERKTKTLHTIDGKWKTDSIVKFKVVAWQPLPEPYKPQQRS